MPDRRLVAFTPDAVRQLAGQGAVAGEQGAETLRTLGRRRPRRRSLRPGRDRLQIFGFTDLRSPHRTEVVVLVRSRFECMASYGIAAEQARARLPGAWVTSIRSVPAPRPTPRLDALCRKHTAFPNFLSLLTAAGGYRPSIRLDLAGEEGRELAQAYDAWQARWGDPRRALVWPEPGGRARRRRLGR